MTLPTGRAGHTATALANGWLLIVGGRDWKNIFAPAELLDPASGTWYAAGSMNAGRYRHAAIRLPGGRILVAGGTAPVPGSNGTVTQATAELYEPATGTWCEAAAMQVPRDNATATLLRVGRVLVCGGKSVRDTWASTETFDPGRGEWHAGGEMSTPRVGHTATQLADGRVLVVGGAHIGLLATAEIYDPASGTWSETGSLTHARRDHTATLLRDGRVLVAGGEGRGSEGAVVLQWPEVYDPARGTWTAGILQTPRKRHTATLLADGRVLLCGGEGRPSVGALASAEIWDPRPSIRVGPRGTPAMNGARFDHTATPLRSGRVLVFGGYGPGYLATVEIYDPRLNAWMVQPSRQGQVSRQAPPQLSADGRWWWTGTEWIDAAKRPVMATTS